MSILLLVLAVLVVGITAFFAVGRYRPGGREPAVVPGLVEPTPNLPPVLLPENPGAADVARIRFSLGFRGYRMDQVDEVLDRLAAALQERDELLEQLRGESQESQRRTNEGEAQ